jgi:hypothetical protein
VATLLSVWVQAYNTKLIKKEDLPRSYRDLLDAKWKDKLGIESEDQEWLATVVQEMGEEQGLKFFRELASRNRISVRQGHSLLNNLVISGEVPFALTVYNYMPEAAKRKGAPVDWIVLEPAVARPNSIGIARHAPHPNAALLFYDYMITDAQELLVSLDYVPTNAAAHSPLKNLGSNSSIRRLCWIKGTSGPKSMRRSSSNAAVCNEGTPRVRQAVINRTRFPQRLLAHFKIVAAKINEDRTTRLVCSCCADARDMRIWIRPPGT